jgi:hypothetical protein
MLEQLDAAKATAILEDQSKIDQLTNTLANNGEAASILSSDDYTIHERVNAFRELHDAIISLGDSEITEAFETVNSE